jgi:hypothetical protein
MTKQAEDFIAEMLPGALGSERRYGIPACITIAQAALESGWGAHTPGNNMFGVTVGDGWEGKDHNLKTVEEEKGEKVTTHQRFRFYESRKESLEDYTKILSEKKMYAGVLIAKDGKSYTEEDAYHVAHVLQKAGYCPGHDYAKQLINIIKRYKLAEIKSTQIPAVLPDATTLCKEINNCKPYDQQTGINREIEIANRHEAFDKLGWPRAKVDTLPGGVRGNMALAILQSAATTVHDPLMDTTGVAMIKPATDHPVPAPILRQNFPIKRFDAGK